MSKANYLSIKRTVETEEWFDVRDTHWTAERIKNGLENGDLNIIQLTAVEPLLWIVDKNGRRIATLEKDGGYGPDHKTEVKVYDRPSASVTV